jgi:phosphoribosylaminoimidazole-succinocarboxamide synthase
LPPCPAGNILLIDEIHTPDSSRYWIADTYAQQHAEVRAIRWREAGQGTAAAALLCVLMHLHTCTFACICPCCCCCLQGQEPQNIDKEFLRLWFRANCDPYNDPVGGSRTALSCKLLAFRSWPAPLTRFFAIRTHAHAQVLPEAPAELRAELSRRYVLLYEKITGQQFQPAPLAEEPGQRMRRNVAAALEQL